MNVAPASAGWACGAWGLNGATWSIGDFANAAWRRCDAIVAVGPAETAALVSVV